MLRQRLIQVVLLGVTAAATCSMSVSIVQAAEECRLKPGSTAPSGSRWLYRINRADHRHCWYLTPAGKCVACTKQKPRDTARDAAKRKGRCPGRSESAARSRLWRHYPVSRLRK